MTAPMDEAIRARLQFDLDELLDDPCAGTHIFPPKENKTEFCLVFTLSEGPWQGLNLHFKVSFGGRWPATPPIIQSIPSLSHPLLTDSYIACQLFGPKHLPPGYTSLYAIPLRVLFVQLFRLFSDYRILCTTRRDELAAAIFGEPIGRYDSEPTNERHGNDNLWGALHHQLRTNSDPDIQLGRSLMEGESIKQHAKGDNPISSPQRTCLVGQSSPFWIEAHQVLSIFRCPLCPYGSADFPHVTHDTHSSSSAIGSGRQAVSTNDETRTFHLEALNDDILGVIALHTPTESLRRFAEAYPRMSWVITSTRLLPRRELSCVFLRRPIRDVILGIVVTMRFYTHTVVSSKFEWFSMEAVENHKAGGPYFLPLAFEPRHFERAEEHIWASVDTINGAILSMYQAHGVKYPMPNDWQWMKWANKQLGTRNMASGESLPRSQRSMSLLFWMMEGIVESLFETGGKELKRTAQRSKPFNKFILRSTSQVEAAIISYGLLFHLLLCLYRSELDLFCKVADHVRTNQDSGARHFLDESLILTMIVKVLHSVHTCNPVEDPVDLSIVIDTYLGVIIRDTSSIHGLTPSLAEVGPDDDSPGMWAVFYSNAVNFQKIMFHVLFLRTFQQFYRGEFGLFKLDDSFGFLEDEAINIMARGVEEICQVENSSQFLHFINFAKGP